MKDDINKIREDVLAFIETIEELSPEKKARYGEMIKKSEDPVEVLDAMEDDIQNRIRSHFKEAGIEIDQKDPQYQAACKEMMDEIQAAEKDFNDEMGDIEKEAQAIQQDASQAVDDVKLQAVRAGLEE
jgi:hypothetical protein